MSIYSLASFSRTLTDRDTKQNIPFQVQVPEHITQLNIRLTFTPWVVDGFKNLITLTVFDPSGFRGAGHRHGNEHQVVLNAQNATPGYRAGAIQSGEWTIVVDTHLVMPGAPVELYLEISAGDELDIQHSTSDFRLPTSDFRPLTSNLPRPTSNLHSPTWYRGDLHAHTIHSDARWDVPDLVAWARANNLDFVTLSDHNTVSALAQMDAAHENNFLTMGGMELTTFWGHALALGLREWVDWRARLGERTMPQIAAEVIARGGTYIIAHPCSIGDPFCTGCQWRYEEMMPGNARLVEVWNESWHSESDNNAEAFALATTWLDQGYRITMTSGTDNHGRSQDTRPYAFNVVYADELSEREILRALRAGRSYLSSGPTLEVNAAVGAQRAMIGDALKVSNGEKISVTARWEDAPTNAELSLTVDGEIRESVKIDARGSHSWNLENARWCLATLRGAEETILALTNAIYFDGRV